MIKNISKQTVLASTFSIKSGLGKMKGLLFNDMPEALTFETRFGVHTFLLKFPIDLILVDKNKKVVFIKEEIKPNRIVLWNPKYKIVLELKTGSIKKSKTQIGDLLEFN